MVRPSSTLLSNPLWRSAHPRESGVRTVTPGTGGLGQCLSRQERGPRGARQGGEGLVPEGPLGLPTRSAEVHSGYRSCPQI